MYCTTHISSYNLVIIKGYISRGVIGWFEDRRRWSPWHHRGLARVALREKVTVENLKTQHANFGQYKCTQEHIHVGRLGFFDRNNDTPWRVEMRVEMSHEVTAWEAETYDCSAQHGQHRLPPCKSVENSRELHSHALHLQLYMAASWSTNPSCNPTTTCTFFIYVHVSVCIYGQITHQLFTYLTALKLTLQHMADVPGLVSVCIGLVHYSQESVHTRVEYGVMNSWHNSL